ncbi:unnamed protein product, partial [Gordionus sp. m RMFG-2023]
TEAGTSRFRGKTTNTPSGLDKEMERPSVDIRRVDVRDQFLNGVRGTDGGDILQRLVTNTLTVDASQMARADDFWNKVWGLLAQEYKTNVTSLKSLWKNLRDCLIKETKDMLFMVETITPRSQKSSLDKEDSSSIEVRDIFNEMTGERDDCDFIDTDNTSDVTVINKDSVTLNLNDSESIPCVGSPSSYYKYPKRKNNNMDEYRDLIKFEKEKSLLTFELLKNKSTEYGICLMLKEKLDDCTKQEKKELTTRIFDVIKDFN